MVLVFTMDSESRNKAAKDLLEEKKNENTIDSYLALSQCLPDPFHVGHVVENGYGINPVQLTILTLSRPRGSPLTSKIVWR